MGKGGEGQERIGVAILSGLVRRGLFEKVVR